MTRCRNTYTRVGRVSMPDNESLCKTIFDITRNDLEIVAALVAAAACERPGATCAELRELTGHHASSGMNHLERKLWVTRVARVERSTTFIWAATPLAAKRLGLADWQVELQRESAARRPRSRRHGGRAGRRKGRVVSEHPATDLIVNWWAERFQVEDKREAFRTALREAFCAEWQVEAPRVRLSVDYDPEGILLAAVNAAGVPCRGFMFSATGILPQKTRMRVSLEDIQVSEGYGAPFDQIWRAP